MGGAKRGLAISPWTFKPSDDLAALRAAMSLGQAQRHRTFREIAARLRLEHLATFLETSRRGRRNHSSRRQTRKLKSQPDRQVQARPDQLASRWF